MDYFLNIARACGIEAKTRSYEFFTTSREQSYIADLFQEHGLKKSDFLVVINPGGNWDLKRWPKENFAQLADRLIKDYQAKVLLTGAKKDLSLAQDIAALMKGRPIILCGKTSLGQLAALMENVNLVISNDSGPMHIALSQKARVIALFGPTSCKITGPYGQNNYLVIQKDVGCKVPCYQLNCRNNRCMKAISVDEVLQAAAESKK